MVLSPQSTKHGPGTSSFVQLCFPFSSFPNSLFHFRYGRPESDPAPGPFDKRCDMSIVKVDIRGTPDSNDLVSCLSSELLSSDSPTGGKGQNQVIFYPSDVVAFQLSREFITGNKNSERHIFAYPKSMHMDQFLKENYGFAMEKRKLQKELTVEIEKLNERKLALSKHDVSSSLSLPSSF